MIERISMYSNKKERKTITVAHAVAIYTAHEIYMCFETMDTHDDHADPTYSYARLL